MVAKTTTLPALRCGNFFLSVSVRYRQVFLQRGTASLFRRSEIGRCRTQCQRPAQPAL